MNETKTIYLAFSGLGKTYFCQHAAGWLDFDLESFVDQSGQLADISYYKLIPKLLENYTKYGYRILVGATPSVISILNILYTKYNFVLFMPENTEEMRDEIIKRCDRYGDNYPEVLKTNYILMYQSMISAASVFDCKLIYLKSNEYLSDVIQRYINEEN